VVAVREYSVWAKRWDEGWELHVDGVGVTQVRTLDKAYDQVVHFLETMELPVEGYRIDLRFDLEGLEDKVAEARHLTRQAQDLQLEAAVMMRHMAHALRDERGLSVTDTAAVLGVSRGRVSQLMSS
jgi:predicted XRE-type DNA-binding protein